MEEQKGYCVAVWRRPMHKVDARILKVRLKMGESVNAVLLSTPVKPFPPVFAERLDAVESKTFDPHCASFFQRTEVRLRVLIDFLLSSFFMISGTMKAI